MDQDTRLAAYLAPLFTLVAALEAAGVPTAPVDRLLEPLTSATLPACLRVPVAAYLATLPGYTAGDTVHAADQHALRVALWRGEAHCIPAADAVELGLTELEADG